MLKWIYRRTNTRRIKRIEEHAFDLMCMGRDNSIPVQQALDNAKDALYELSQVIKDEQHNKTP